MVMAWIRFIDWVQGSSVLMKALGARPARIKAYQTPLTLIESEIKNGTIWFHSASVGELEMQRALIDDLTEKGETIGVTCFSDSALKTVHSLNETAVYAGLSPKECDWLPLFIHFKVKKLIVSKYDLWPGMVLAASTLQIPILVINARMGGSLQFIRFLFKFSRTALPQFYFFALRKKDQVALKKSFPDFEVKLSMDPRFERVARRVDQKNHSDALTMWSEKVSKLQGPIGILGSVWSEDLKRLLPAVTPSLDGSLVVVPHSLAPLELAKIRSLLERSGLSSYVLVDQMGLLVELYSFADWVWVGGGFGSGIHSTLEPSFYGVPIACGPNRVSDFPETESLIKSGWLTVCASKAEIVKWVRDLKNGDLNAGAQRKNRIIIQQNRAEKKSQYSALLEECIRIR